MPAILDRICKRVYLPPFLAEDAETMAYVLNGSEEAINNNIIRPALGEGFSASFGGLFVLAWVRYGAFRSETSPDDSKGSLGYEESAIFLLVDGPDDEKYIFIPSLYLESSAATATGRDVYGFPKSIGRVVMPASVSDSGAGQLCSTHADEVHSYGMPPEKPQDSLVYEAFGPNEPFRLITRLEHRPESLDGDDELFVRQSLQEFVSEIGATSAFDTTDRRLLGSSSMLLGSILTFSSKLIFVKQLPSVVQSELGKTSYQALVRARFQILGFPQIGLLSFAIRVRMFDYASAPLAAAFGVTSGAELNPLIGVWGKCDLRMGHGTETPIP